MIVTCINDKHLPEGASVVKDNDYNVIKEYVNGFGQKAYIIEGVCNSGTTPRGLKWEGYSAHRFRVKEKTENKIEEFAYAMN